jgi:hypothetical protein
MVHHSAPPTSAQSLQAQLHAGGATDLQVSTNPAWVVGRAPSGRLIQLLWDPTQHGYYVSHWTAEQSAARPLGVFPEPEVAVAHALQA